MKALILILWTLLIALPVVGQTKMVIHKTKGENDTLATSAVVKITFFTEVPPTVTDIDGNVYHIVQIGTQEWTIENLRTTKYNDGTAIPNITDNTGWITTIDGAYCVYDNDENNAATCGYLYNWSAVNSGKLAPEGWRVPSDTDWNTLGIFVGGLSIAGEKLKSTSGWNAEGNGTDDFGFNAVPCGKRDDDGGAYEGFGDYTRWWSTTGDGSTHAGGWRIYFDSTELTRVSHDQTDGYSIRLVRDIE